MEIWKDIKGYEGYQVSNLGRIRTYNKITYTKKHGKRHWNNRILKFKPSKPKGTGYRISLWKNGKSKDYLVARLVATTFLEDLINTNMTVNHKDGNRLNNKVDNLEWLSRKENIQYGFNNGQYEKTCKKCKLKIYNKTIQFDSLSSASRYIGRKNGYWSTNIKKGKYCVEDTKFGTVSIYF